MKGTGVDSGRGGTHMHECVHRNLHCAPQMVNILPKKACVHRGTARTHFGQLCEDPNHGSFPERLCCKWGGLLALELLFAECKGGGGEAAQSFLCTSPGTEIAWIRGL